MHKAKIRAAILALLLFPAFAQAEDAATIKKFLADNLDLDKQPAGIVVGYVDEKGSWIVTHGRVGGGRDMDGDTVFEIGSITKTFAALLLLDMAERGEMQLDDPVAKYLPDSVKVPSRGGKQITLLNLAAQDSGLPWNADNLRGRDFKAQLESYTPDMMYSYLSRHNLSAEPGAAFHYSNIGVALLGHAIERRAGKDLDTLFAERICRPLGMNSTRIRLTPELKSRLAPGHGPDGKPTPPWELTVLAGTGGLRSTANDLLKYVSAQLGLPDSPLTPLMKQTHEIRHRGDSEFGNTAMPWVDDCIIQPSGSQILGHGGGTSGYSAFVGFDVKRRRGFVVLANQAGKFSARSLGWRLIQGESLDGQQFATIAPRRQHVGIGAALELDQETQAIRIRKVLDDSPASRAGLSAGWLILAVDDVPMAGKTPQDCAALIRGERGRKVRLELINPKDEERLTVEITRGTFSTGEG